MTTWLSLRRVLPARVGLIVFLAVAALWLTGAHHTYAAFFNLLRVRSFRFPFLDTQGVLAAIECHRQAAGTRGGGAGCCSEVLPVTLISLAVRERWPRCLTFIALSLAMLGACLLPEEASLVRALRLVPTGIGDTFGAMDVPVALATGLGWPRGSQMLLASRILIQATLTMWMAVRAVRLSQQLRPGLSRLPEMERVFLMVGATMIVGRFLAGPSAGYRSIHLLFTLPALLTLAAETSGRLPRAAVALVLWVMWGDALRTVPGKLDALWWLADQAAWWVLVTVLSALLPGLLRESLALQSLRGIESASARLKNAAKQN